MDSGEAISFAVEIVVKAAFTNKGTFGSCHVKEGNLKVI